MRFPCSKCRALVDDGRIEVSKAGGDFYGGAPAYCARHTGRCKGLTYITKKMAEELRRGTRVRGTLNR